MKDSSTLTIVQHTYDLLLYLVPTLAKYPRSQKFVLADRIQNATTNLLEALIRAAYHPRGEAKRALLQQINLDLEVLRYLIRLSKDLHCLDLRRYELIQQKIHEIGLQNGAWLRSLT